MSDLYTLEKSLWTETDFEEMGWHDATIHAIATPNSEFEIAFDIDYILKWVDPAEDQTHFRYWVSPATLVFWNLLILSYGRDRIASKRLSEPFPLILSTYPD